SLGREADWAFRRRRSSELRYFVVNDVYTAELPELNARPAPKGLRLAAIITGLLGFVLFLATPFLPVTQTQSSFDWPANDSLNSVTAPLISVSPEEIEDRKSTRLNSSHVSISYAVFCLKKK